MEFLINWWYFGVLICSFLSATLVPFSSDVLLIGLLALGSNIWLTVLIATSGNWLGSLTTYYIGHLGKWEWIERWFKITPEKLHQQQVKIEKYGVWLAFFVWLPFVGDVFAVALGFYRINFTKCATLMLLGKFARFSVWGLLFYFGWLKPFAFWFVRN